MHIMPPQLAPDLRDYVASWSTAAAARPDTPAVRELDRRTVLELDRRIVEELETHSWDGLLMRLVEDRLVLYAWGVLHSKMHNGSIAAVALGDIPPTVLTAEHLQLLHESRELRDALTADSVHGAWPRFIQAVKEGRWNGSYSKVDESTGDDRGAANLRTYFVNGALREFHHTVARKWVKSHGEDARWLSAAADFEVLSTLPDSSLTAKEHDAIEILIPHLDPIQQQICQSIYDGDTHSEIASDLQITPKAVERRVARIRATAWKLVRSGRIPASVIPRSRAATAAAMQ